MEKQRQHEGVGRDGVKEGSESSDFRAELCIPSDTNHGESSRMLLDNSRQWGDCNFKVHKAHCTAEINERAGKRRSMVGMEKRIAIQEDSVISIFPRMQGVGMNACRNTELGMQNILLFCIKKYAC